MVSRLFTKSIKLNLIDVISIFSVPKSPGQIYIEAQSSDPLVRLFTGIHYLYICSLFVVPIVKCVALLQADKSLPLIEEDTYVKIQNGLYKDDVGKVVAVLGGHNMLTLNYKAEKLFPEN